MRRLTCLSADPVSLAIEDALLEALDTTVRWSIAGDGLDLFDADGTAVASFEARNL